MCDGERRGGGEARRDAAEWSEGYRYVAVQKSDVFVVELHVKEAYVNCVKCCNCMERCMAVQERDIWMQREICNCL